MINKTIAQCSLAAVIVFLIARISLADVSSDVTVLQNSIGSVTNWALMSCPTGTTGILPGSTCYSGTVNCPNIAPIIFTLEVTNPTGTPKGTIMTHSENGGEGFFSYPNSAHLLTSAYVNAGFQVIQLSWTTDWEANSLLNMMDSACRPATVFQYVHDNFYAGGTSPVYSPSTNANAGFCLEGHSAGSAAIAYYLSHYKGVLYVDKALMAAGPHFADLEQGCEVIGPGVYAPLVTICPNGPGVWPCAKGVDAAGTWTESPAYLGQQPDGWVGGTCANAAGTQTTPSANIAWLGMSINDAASTPDANYTMTKTSISAYECGPNVSTKGNPSEAQGWLYYSQFGKGKVANLVVNEANDCNNAGNPNAEYVYDASTINNSTGTALPSLGYWGATVIYNDMINDCYRRH